MSYSLKQKCAAAAAAMGMLLSSPVRAENIFESIFHLMSHPDQPRAASPARAMTLTVHRHAAAKGHARQKLTAQTAHKAGKPALAENEKFLSSASFSQKFRASESGQKETQEAISYLVAHDATLRRGDALVTQNGVVVFDPDRSNAGAFVPVNDRHVEKPLQKRLTGLVEPGGRYGSNMVALAAQSGKYASANGSEAKPEATAEQKKVETADGRTIRFVGGYVAPERFSLSSVRD